MCVNVGRKTKEEERKKQKVHGTNGLPAEYFLANNKLEQSYGYTKRLVKSRFYLPLKKRNMVFYLNKRESPLPKFG